MSRILTYVLSFVDSVGTDVSFFDFRLVISELMRE